MLRCKELIKKVQGESSFEDDHSSGQRQDVSRHEASLPLARNEETCGRVCGNMFEFSIGQGRAKETKWTVVTIECSSVEMGEHCDDPPLTVPKIGNKII